MKHLRRYPLTLCCVALTFYLCLMIVPDTPLSKVKGIDKWAHVLMYFGTCSVLWLEFYRSHARPHRLRMLLWGIVAPIIMSGFIELLQSASGYRSGDWRDFLANSIGVLLAYGFAEIARKRWQRLYRKNR